SDAHSAGDEHTTRDALSARACRRVVVTAARHFVRLACCAGRACAPLPGFLMFSSDATAILTV
ncbi:MAG: hypothetical protein ACPIOQ_43745, partial [Promethearchaeia archaeon]